MENDIKEWGYKFHMNDINATIGLSNLPYMNNNLEIIRDNAIFYDRELNNIKGLEIVSQVVGSRSAYWLYTIKIINKEKFIDFMKERNVMVSQVHNRNDTHSCVNEYRKELPILDKLEKEIVCIPVGWWITENNREYIVKCIKEFLNTTKA
jgi:dTDP-4-amino-4,6-dideoxygalactose transaminase